MPRPTTLGLLQIPILFATLAYSAELSVDRKREPNACRPAPRLSASSADDLSWQLHQSRNFTVCCPRTFDGEAAVRQCERLRENLSEKWLGTVAEDWTSRCYVVFHPTATTYVQSAGRDSEQTAGCSTVKELAGRVLSRRIDLRLDRPEPLMRTLPHEMTHVVLAEIAARRQLPRWADEGIAMLADPPDKREGHRRDLLAALNQGAALRVPALLLMNDYPEPRQTAAFYGQSLSLVEFLTERKGSLTLQRFLTSSANDGYQKALDENYGIRDAHELERLWLASVYPVLHTAQ